MKQRECGECQLCCELLAVKERGHLPSGEAYAFHKPDRTKCAHQCAAGCAIYNSEHLPIACRAFECEWLLGHFRESDRPDRSGVIASLRRAPDGSVLACLYGVRHSIVGSEMRLDLRNAGASRTLAALKALPGVQWIQFMHIETEPGVNLAFHRTGRRAQDWEGARITFTKELDWVEGDDEREIVRELFGDVTPPHRFRSRLDNLSKEEQAHYQARLDQRRRTS